MIESFSCDLKPLRRGTNKMKLLLFVALICLCLKHVSLEQHHKETNLDEQIHNLQVEVKLHRQLLKMVRLLNIFREYGLVICVFNQLGILQVLLAIIQ